MALFPAASTAEWEYQFRRKRRTFLADSRTSPRCFEMPDLTSMTRADGGRAQSAGDYYELNRLSSATPCHPIELRARTAVFHM